MGYTPVFDTIFTGTLCGKYPDTAAWMFFLAMADKEGVVDCTPQYISSVTGMPLDELVACIERFMQPDPHSRTTDHDGRRLVKLDENRDWGWKVVNHGKYKEKARLQAKNAREVATGQNRERIKDRRRPPETAADPLSNTNTYTNKEKSKSASRSRTPPADFQISERVLEWASAECPNVDLNRELSKFLDHEFNTPRSDWEKCFRNWIRTASERKGASDDRRLSAIERVNRATGGARF